MRPEQEIDATLPPTTQASCPDEEADVRVLIRHHIEAQGIWKLSPDPPVRLEPGVRIERAGLCLALNEEVVMLSMAGGPESLTLHQHGSAPREVTLPVELAVRELVRGLTWVHIDEVCATRGLYLVNLLGELFAGEMRRRTHVLCAGVTLCRADFLHALWRVCEEEDPWLLDRIDLWEPSPWGVMLGLGALLRHAPLWSSAPARERVYGVLSRWREELTLQAREVMWDLFEERSEHVRELLATGARGALLGELREHLAGAAATLEWLDMDASASCALVDALVDEVPQRDAPQDGETQRVMRLLLIDGEVWWAS